MESFLVMKEQLKNIYSKYDVYITPLLKFLMAFVVLLQINGKLGYMTKIDNIAIVLLVALMCSFLPVNFIIVVAAGFVLAHLYALSLECAVVVLCIFVLLFLLYFRFSPKDTVVVLLTPLCFMLKVPFVMPLAMGLVGTPASVVSVAGGVIVYYIIDFISSNASTVTLLDADGAVAKFRFVIDGIMSNKLMFVAVLSFSITIIIVYLIRRMSIDHSWTIAMISGALGSVMILLVGDLVYNTKVSIPAIFIGAIVSVGIVKILQFFVFNVDYSRTENVQFEDDEYYYYVKAVPKITVTVPDKTVKKINAPKVGDNSNRTAASDARVRQSVSTQRSSTDSRSSAQGRPVDRTADRPVDRTVERTVDRTIDRAMERSGLSQRSTTPATRTAPAGGERPMGTRTTAGTRTSMGAGTTSGNRTSVGSRTGASSFDPNRTRVTPTRD